MNMKNQDLGSAMLQRGRSSPSETSQVLQNVELPLLLTLDQIRPNPDNPRTSRNPKYDEIKASIKARGLSSVPKVTRDPEGDGHYMFSDGGNTRYQILLELWQETADNQFFQFHCIFKPWPGRLQCIIGHLAENEARGDLSFIEKALGVLNAQKIYEKQFKETLSFRKLATVLTEQGLPTHYSVVSRMTDTINYLYPYLPTLLSDGLGRHQIELLLGLRKDAQKTWLSYQTGSKQGSVERFLVVFAECCSQFDCLETWSLPMFIDEFIGALVTAFPHPSLNYERWLLELSPKERNRRQVLQDDKLLPAIEDTATTINLTLPAEKNQLTKSQPTLTLVSSPPVIIPSIHEENIQIDNDLAVISNESIEEHCDQYAFEDFLSETYAQAELEPVGDIWTISPLQDDIEHLQAMSFRLSFELAETLGVESEILPSSESQHSAGFYLLNPPTSSPFPQLLFSLTCPASPAPPVTLTQFFIGTDEATMLSDVQAMKLMRLVRIQRRLQQLQISVMTRKKENVK
ncbi:hypothetical protein BS639_17310 [Rouxiella silvae]|uniref:Chromosome partitioning protein ParB n=1 Tax=Rouxiella silvae TaxID=1646373 RepID=A0ABX3TXH7_9GAMM|nr:ParB family protein [Rouxiella silvae]ORJ19937.1 hypothetical protein BS639_17310 [Rouxiella silvae]